MNYPSSRISHLLTTRVLLYTTKNSLQNVLEISWKLIGGKKSILNFTTANHSEQTPHSYIEYIKDMRGQA